MLQTAPQITPIAHLHATQPDIPVLYFSRAELAKRVRVFQNGLDGTLCYAVKCNPHAEILQAMSELGIDEFDVASPAEIRLIRTVAHDARMNYNNPIRSRDEIAFALQMGVRSFSVDCVEELAKLADVAGDLRAQCEVSVRLKLDLDGAAYHFGAKFGETPDGVVELLRAASKLAFQTSGTFHVGTQCENPENYRLYTEAMAECAREAGVAIARLNVGGGFPSARHGDTPDFSAYFAAIEQGLKSFETRPLLLAEPGRALIADACQYAVRIKSMRQGQWVFLNDGIYGGLNEMAQVGLLPFQILSPAGERREGDAQSHHIYGPTCDSVDHMSEEFLLPASTQDGDFVLFHGAGAYVWGVNTQFNGYGEINFVKVDSLSL